MSHSELPQRFGKSLRKMKVTPGWPQPGDLSPAIEPEWVVWRNQHSGNMTVASHAIRDHRTLCGRSPGDLSTHAPLTTNKCQKCLTTLTNEKQFAQLRSVGESAEK